MQGRRRRYPVRAMPGRRPKFPRALYWVIGLGAVALSAGFAVGTLTFGSFGFMPHQAGASGVPPSPPAGISFPLAEAELASATSTPAAGACVTSNLGTNATPTQLVNGTNTTICLSTHSGGFSIGDTIYIMEVAWNASAPLSMTFQVQVYLGVSPSANSIVVTSYIETSAAITSHEGAVFAFDLSQSSDTAITGFTVLVTQE